jgi:hypothetical protein
MINPNLILTVIYPNVILSAAGNFAKRSRLRSRRDPIPSTAAAKPSPTDPRPSTETGSIPKRFYVYH